MAKGKELTNDQKIAMEHAIYAAFEQHTYMNGHIVLSLIESLEGDEHDEFVHFVAEELARNAQYEGALIIAEKFELDLSKGAWSLIVKASNLGDAPWREKANVLLLTQVSRQIDREKAATKNRSHIPFIVEGPSGTQ